MIRGQKSGRLLSYDPKYNMNNNNFDSDGISTLYDGINFCKNHGSIYVNDDESYILAQEEQYIRTNNDLADDDVGDESGIASTSSISKTWKKYSLEQKQQQLYSEKEENIGTSLKSLHTDDDSDCSTSINKFKNILVVNDQSISFSNKITRRARVESFLFYDIIMKLQHPYDFIVRNLILILPRIFIETLLLPVISYIMQLTTTNKKYKNKKSISSINNNYIRILQKTNTIKVCGNNNRVENYADETNDDGSNGNCKSNVKNDDKNNNNIRMQELLLPRQIHIRDNDEDDTVILLCNQKISIHENKLYFSGIRRRKRRKELAASTATAKKISIFPLLFSPFTTSSNEGTEYQYFYDSFVGTYDLN